MKLRLPLTVRLTLWYGLSMVILLGLLLGALATSVHWEAHAALHQRLFSAQATLVPDVRVVDGVPRLDPPLAARDGSFGIGGALGLYARLLSNDGTVLDRSPNFEGVGGSFAPNLPVGSEVTERDATWGNQPMRAFYVALKAGDGQAGWLEVSGYAWNVRRHIPGWQLWASIGATLLLALVGGYLLARQALGPVRRMSAAARRITASDLGVRLPLSDRVEDELTDLAATFNGMLERLEAAFERERRFTANAAHEMLNPLAAVRNEVEVALRQPRDDAAYVETLRTLLVDVVRLGHMVEQLLELARVESGAGVARVPVDVAAVCGAQMPRWRAMAGRRGITLQFEMDDDAVIRAGEGHLQTILDNLVDNAVKYTPSGGAVSIAVRSEPGVVGFSVTDTGAGFSAAEADQLFDRFFRSNDTTVQSKAGSGLGLALVQALVQANGGTISARSDGPGLGSTFTVRFDREA